MSWVLNRLNQEFDLKKIFQDFVNFRRKNKEHNSQFFPFWKEEWVSHRRYKSAIHNPINQNIQTFINHSNTSSFFDHNSINHNISNPSSLNYSSTNISVNNDIYYSPIYRHLPCNIFSSSNNSLTSTDCVNNSPNNYMPSSLYNPHKTDI